MKISLMIEGSLPGEGLVTYGNEEDDDGGFMLQLARGILQDMENGVTRKSMEETGEELQALYEEIAALAKEQQEYAGEETTASVIDFEPITLKALEPLPSEPGASVTQKVPAPVTIMTVPTSQLLDPWAPYRAKVEALQAGKKRATRKRAKKGGMDESIYLGLWASVEQEQAAPKPAPKSRAKTHAVDYEQGLWAGMEF